MTDVLIAGAGPAGASLAILLGRAGFSVELHDRARFPREKPCGEGVMPAGVEALNRLGVEIEGQPFQGIRYRHGPLDIEGNFPATPGLPDYGLGIRRLHLDEALFRTAASTPRVRAFESSAVEEPLLTNGVVVGARVNGAARPARLVVAADGVHSGVRRSLGLNGDSSGSPRYGLRAHFLLSPHARFSDFVEVYLGRRQEMYVTRLPGNELQVSLLAWRNLNGVSARSAFWSAIAAQPSLAAVLESATQITEFQGLSPLAATARAGVFPGGVLLGDAAGFMDPITGGGITQALLTADLLARHLQTRFTANMDDLLVYDRARSDLLADYRHLTAMVLYAARVPALSSLLLRFLRLCPSAFSHLVGVSGGVRHLIPGRVAPLAW